MIIKGKTSLLHQYWITSSRLNYRPGSKGFAEIARQSAAALLIASLFLFTASCLAAEDTSSSDAEAASSAVEVPAPQTKVLDYESSLRNQVASIAHEEATISHQIGGPSAIQALEFLLV